MLDKPERRSHIWVQCDFVGLSDTMAKQPAVKGRKRDSAARANEPDIIGGPIQRPYPGLRSVPARVIRQAVRAVVRQRAANSGD